MRRTYIVPLGLLLLFGTSGFAQERRWTLEECIAHAYEHNIEIKTEELTAAEKRIALSESKWNYAPDLSVSNSSSLATGRVLDETTYEFVENETVAGNSSSLGANILLFGGLKNYYNLKRAQLDLRSSLLAVEKMRNDVRMNVTAYYLEILCAEETIRDAEQVVAELRIQEEKTAKKVEARKVTTADLLQIRSQLADAENDVLTARNTYDIARLDLCQLLEIEDYTTFRTVAPDVGELTRYDIADSPAEVLDAARGLPELEAARVGVDMARRDLQIARTAYWPTLSLSAGYGSSYSDVRQKMFRNPDAPIGMRHIRFSSSTGTMRAAMCRCRSASRFSGSSRSARTCSGRSSPYGRPNTPCERPRNRWRRRLRKRSSTPERRGSDTAERSDTSPRPRRPPGRSHASTTSAPRP